MLGTKRAHALLLPHSSADSPVSPQQEYADRFFQQYSRPLTTVADENEYERRDENDGATAPNASLPPPQRRPLFGYVQLLAPHADRKYLKLIDAALERHLRSMLQRHPDLAIVFMGDHGPPANVDQWPAFFSLILPREYFGKGSLASDLGVREALRDNQEVLASHYDLHETLEDLVHIFSGGHGLGPRPEVSTSGGGGWYDPNVVGKGRPTRRFAPLSMLRPMNKSRGCEAAGIPAAHCSCGGKWHNGGNEGTEEGINTRSCDGGDDGGGGDGGGGRGVCGRNVGGRNGGSNSGSDADAEASSSTSHTMHFDADSTAVRMLAEHLVGRLNNEVAAHAPQCVYPLHLASIDRVTWLRVEQTNEVEEGGSGGGGGSGGVANAQGGAGETVVFDLQFSLREGDPPRQYQAVVEAFPIELIDRHTLEMSISSFVQKTRYKKYERCTPPGASAFSCVCVEE